MRLSQHFTLEEFTRTSLAQYTDKNRDAVGPYLQNLLKVCTELEKLRDFIFRPVYIYSGFRCDDLNTAVGGVSSSQHLTGSAADFAVKDFDDIKGLEFIFNWCLKNMEYGQLIFEKKKGHKPWIHFGLPREGFPPSAYVCDNGKYQIIR